MEMPWGGLLIILFWLAPFPDITDADLEALEAQISEHGEDTSPLKSQFNRFFVVWSQFFYVGAQVAVAGYFINISKRLSKPLQYHVSYMEKTISRCSSLAMLS